MAESHPLVRLARRAIDAYVRYREEISASPALGSELQRKAGVFVTIHRHGQLRGCIGTIEPTQGSVAEEVIRNAISAASRDPRFSPVLVDELEDLELKVDVLAEPEKIDSTDQLDPKRYGLIVQSRSETWKRGLLLPNLEGMDTVDKQVYWTRVHKAGITDPDEPVNMYRFEVTRCT